VSHPRERLSAFLDGELARPERAEIEGHLRACAECARALEEIAAVDTMARGLPVEAPAGYFDALPARIRARVHARGRRRAWVPAAWAAAAAAVLVAVVAPLTVRHAAETPAAGPVEAPAAAPVPRADESRERLAEAERSAPPGAAAATPERAQAPAPPLLQPKQGFSEDARNQDKVSPRLEARDIAGMTKEQALKDAALQKTEDRVAAPPAAPAAEPQVANRAALAPGALGGAAAATPTAAPEAEVAAAAKADADEEMAPRKAAPAPTRSGLGAAREHKLSAPGRVYPPPDPARLVEERYQSLLDQRPLTAADARALRDGWEAFVRDQPSGPHADEARVRAIEAGATAWRLGGEASDRDRARAAAQAYLALEAEPQRDRVRALLDTLPPGPP
jgi:hypothetical protein